MKFLYQKSTYGYLYALAAFFLGTLVSAIVKWIGPAIPVEQLIFMRFFLGVLLMFPMIWKSDGPKVFKSSQGPKHILRAVLGVVAIGCFYTGVQEMPLVNYSILHRVYPLFIILLSYIWLKEKVTKTQWIALAFSLVGVFIMVKPNWEVSMEPVLLVLFGSFIAAGSDIVVKKLTQTESSVKIVFYFFLISTVLLAGFMPYIWVYPPNMGVWAAILLFACAGTLAQYFITQSYRYLNANTVGIWSYSEFLWALIFGLGVWGETPTMDLWIGAFFIFMSTFVVQHLHTGIPKSRKMLLAFRKK